MPLSEDPIARYVEKLDWIKPSSELALQKAVQKPFRSTGAGGEKVLSLLHGHWLHEPLHVVLTDVPVGAWTVTVVADGLAALTGKESWNEAADVSLAIGLLGAGSAAVAGWADWSEIRDEGPRRIGLAHALVNVAATGIFAASYLMRRRHRGRAGSRLLALTGYVLVSLSAHLGGNLVYEHGVGVRSPKV